MRRTAIAAILACAMLLAVSVVSPAFGGPSISSVAKTAKKALNSGKSAKRSAAAAKRTANAAKSAAATANGKADQALARPVFNAGQLAVAEGGRTAAPPGEVSTALAFCPAGQRAVSGGGFFNTGAGDGIIASRANGDRSAWFVIGLSTRAASPARSRRPLTARRPVPRSPLGALAPRSERRSRPWQPRSAEWPARQPFGVGPPSLTPNASSREVRPRVPVDEFTEDSPPLRPSRPSPGRSAEGGVPGNRRVPPRVATILRSRAGTST